MTRKLRTLVCAAMLAAPLAPFATPAQDKSADADNTKMNKGDKSTKSPTADRAKNNLSDREVMAHIRRDVVKDKTLSTNAHNVKIVSTNGKVVLRGPVNSEQEKETVEQYAKKYAGDMNVTNEITVKADSK